ncbi:hypothetical protein ACFX2H_011740 [Malus domestica]
MLASGVISLLEEMISNPSSHGPATALYLNLSCLEEAKPIIGTSPDVPFLTQLLQANRQRDQPPPEAEVHLSVEISDNPMTAPEPKPLCKSFSRRKMSKPFRFLWKSKSYSVYQC